MPKNSEDLRDAKITADPALTFGLDELMDVLQGDLVPYLDERCEMTAPILAKRLGVAPQTARHKLIDLEGAGKLERVVRRTSGGNRVEAWRKKGAG